MTEIAQKAGRTWVYKDDLCLQVTNTETHSGIRKHKNGRPQPSFRRRTCKLSLARVPFTYMPQRSCGYQTEARQRDEEKPQQSV